MRSIYQTTTQGQKTRSRLLQQFTPDQEYTREQLIQCSGLTYDQVRRQTKNLVIEGTIQSRMEAGQRYYRLRENFKLCISSFLLVCCWSWSVPVMYSLSSNANHDPIHQTPTLIT